MIFQDNVLREYLKNVYFISGTPCGGKTTITRMLGQAYGIRIYDIDEHFPIHQRLSDSEHQPAMNKRFRDADEFFGRSVEEYTNWLIQNTREQLDYVLADLIRLSASEPILCDCHLTVQEARSFSDASRVAFLIREPIRLVDEYCNRADHQGFSRFIHSATDVEAAKATCNATLRALNEPKYHAIKASEFFRLERDAQSTVEQTLALVAKHFGFA